MITVVSSVVFPVMRTLRIYCLLTTSIYNTVNSIYNTVIIVLIIVIMLYYIPSTFLFYNWKFVPFDYLSPICLLPTLVITDLIAFSFPKSFFFFLMPHSEVPGQRSNLCHSSNNAGSLTGRPSGNSEFSWFWFHI